MKKCYLNGKIVNYDSIKICIDSASIRYSIVLFDAPKLVFNDSKYFLFRFKDYYKRFEKNCKKIGYCLQYSENDLVEMISNLISINGIKGQYAIRINVLYKDKTELITNKDFDLVIYLLDISNREDCDEIDIYISSRKRLIDGEYRYDIKSPANYFTSYLELKCAKQNKFNDILYFNTMNNATEFSRSNLFIIKNNILMTPPVSDGLLDGITRKSIIDIAKICNIEFKEISINIEQLLEADFVFQCGTTVGINRINSINNRIYEKENKIFTILKNKFELIINGKDTMSQLWLNEIGKRK